jgi:hypothetical protein
MTVGDVEPGLGGVRSSQNEHFDIRCFKPCIEVDYKLQHALNALQQTNEGTSHDSWGRRSHEPPITLTSRTGDWPSP